MATFEDIERLLFENDLLKLRKIRRKCRRGFIRDGGESFGQRFGHQSGACRAADTVWRKLREFRVVFFMDTAVGDQEDVTVARCVREPAKIRQKFFRAGYVEFAARLYEVLLRVHFPKDDLFRNCLSFHRVHFITPFCSRTITRIPRQQGCVAGCRQLSLATD